MNKNVLSHPSWVCGLKPSIDGFRASPSRSHPSWVCGLKRSSVLSYFGTFAVTPFVGVWIETCCMMAEFVCRYVTPFVGVWIETEM